MIFEVEIDDSIIDVHKRIFGPDFDVAGFISELMKTSVILLATHQDEVITAFDRSFRENMPADVRDAFKRLVFRFYKPPGEAS